MNEIAVTNSSREDVFFHIPNSLNRQYLEQTISSYYNREISIEDIKATNLCANNWGGVSNSGATVLKLIIKPKGESPIEIVTKILSPDTVNLFKSDFRYDSRLSEVAWADWWGKQHVPYAPMIFGTRADVSRREFWILSEYFQNIATSGSKDFSKDDNYLKLLLKNAASFHAYSHNEIDKLMAIFSGKGIRAGFYCSPQDIINELEPMTKDAKFFSSIGITAEEVLLIQSYCQAINDRPGWVDQWHIASITVDWAPDNFGQRNGPGDSALINADWGTARLGAIEEDLDVLFMRIGNLDEQLKIDLISHYLREYSLLTRHEFSYQDIIRRLPWARFLSTMRYLTEHLKILSWVRLQPRSKELAHLFIGLCKDQLMQCEKC